MSNEYATLHDNVKSAILNKRFDLSLNQKQIEYPAPVSVILPALLSISGGIGEVLNYTQQDKYGLEKMRLAFKSTRFYVARELVTKNPEAKKYALNHPFIKAKIHQGPFEKMKYIEKTVTAMALLLTDINTLLYTKKKGWLDWDDGSCQAMISVIYGWRPLLPIKVKLTQKKEEVFFLARRYMYNLLTQYPDNYLVRFVWERYQLAWYYKNSQQIQTAEEFFRELAEEKGANEKVKTKNLLGNSSCIDLSLRYKKPQILRRSLEEIASQVPAQLFKTSPTILLTNIQLNLLEGNLVTAKKLTDKLYKNDHTFFKRESALLYDQMGQKTKSKNILKKLKTE
ncbi:hypothetical protein ACJD0Z_16035 [Flavobacteriaceae bacterium M23B6Z8]